MGILNDRKPIEYRQLCALIRTVFLKDPTQSDAEWKAASRDVIAKGGWEEPPADMLVRAMGAVERSISETVGWREVPASRPVQHRTPSSAPTPADWTAIAHTLKMIMARSAAAQPENVAGLARETLAISEDAALDQFYAEAASDRQAALRRFAEIAIVRDADWDPAVVRAESRQHTLRPCGCFVCRTQNRDRPLDWHHVIQIQHGGSNTLRNRVALCELCHRDVHPWLPIAPRPQSGFASVGEIAPKAMEALKKLWVRNIA